MFKQTFRFVRIQSQLLVRECKPRNLSSSCKHLVLFEHNDLPVKLFYKLNRINISSRNYSKTRNIKKDKKKTVQISENELGEYLDVEKLLSDLLKPVEIFKDELIQHASLRSASVVGSLKVHHDGDTYTIQDLAEIGRKNPRLIVLDFESFPEVIPSVMKSFEKSELNVNPQHEGTKLFVPLPQVTKEHREVLAKKCKVLFIKCKENIRKAQIKYIKSLEKVDKLPLDDKHRLTDQLTALGDKNISLAEEAMKAKQEELLKVTDGA